MIMKKIFTFIAAMLVAFAVNADPVVLPATLDVNNVSFRSDNLPDFVIADGQDYAGTYLDMGAHDSSNDTALYAGWDVTIQPIKYNVSVDVYNTNSWTIEIFLLNQSDQVVKSLSYHGHSGDKGQFAAGSIDMSDLTAGNYKVRAHAAIAWSAMKLKDIIFVADYSGVSVDLPGTLEPAYAELSSGASVVNNAIAFTPSTANSEYATWNVSFAAAGNYKVTIDYTASNGHTYGVALLSADGATQIGAVAEAQAWDTGVKELGSITVPAAGNYKVKLTNATQWSEAVLNSITLAPMVCTVAGDEELCGIDWANNDPQNDMTYFEGVYRWTSGPVYYDGTSTWEFKVCKDHTWTAFPNDNYELKPDWKMTSGAGYYNVEIVYTSVPEAINVIATYLYPKVELLGNFTNWGTNPLVMLNDINNEYCMAQAEFDNPGIYEYRIRINDASNWKGNTGVMDRANCTGWDMDADHNCGIKIDIPGLYEFKYDFASEQMSVTYAESFTRVNNDGHYQTLCAPFNASITNATVYEVTAASAGGVTINAIDPAMLVAGKSYIVKPTADMVITKVGDGVVGDPILPISQGTGLYGVLSESYTYVYNSEPTWKNVFVLQDDDMFHQVIAGGSATITSTRAYLHIAGDELVPNQGAPGIRIIENATNIQNVEGNETAVKFIENGQLFIKKNGVVYDAVGTIVK